jgi:hypothetical protein
MYAGNDREVACPGSLQGDRDFTEKRETSVSSFKLLISSFQRGTRVERGCASL